MSVADEIPVIAGAGEPVIPVGGKRLICGHPGRVAVSSHNGQQIPDHGSAPSGSCPAVCLKSDPFCQCGQCAHVLISGLTPETADMTVFIFDLYADNIVHKVFCLAVNLFPEKSYFFQITGVIRPKSPAFFHKPVGKTAVSDFRMNPGARAQENRHFAFTAYVQKVTEAAPAGEIKISFKFFVVDPDHIGGQDIHPAGFHFPDFILPAGGGTAGKVKFPHDGKPRFSVFQKTVFVISNVRHHFSFLIHQPFCQYPAISSRMIRI